ncbi:MAG: HAD-IA family hydrolase [Planctomycetota bacterium]
MRVRYDYVLWDFDGTLADSLGHALHVFNELSPQHGFKPIEDHERVREMTSRQFLSEHRVPMWKVPMLFAAFLAAFRKDLDQIGINAGVLACVQGLSAAGIRQAIVSSNEESNILAWLTHHRLDAYFESVTGYSRLFGKEKPLRKQVEASNLPPERLLYVGDEVRDIEAARAAGIDVAAVSWGMNSAALLARHAPTLLVAKPSRLVRHCVGS